MLQHTTKRSDERIARLRSIRARVACLTARRVKAIAVLLITVVVIVAGVIAARARAYNHANPKRVSLTNTSPSLPSRQVSARPFGKSYARLTHQPEAARLRRALGPRFFAPGREKTTLVGTLTVGSDAGTIAIVRTQTDDGEQVEIYGGGGPSSVMTWNPAEGARANGVRSSASRAMIERLALDSPDEFIFAQLRGASYYTIARNVMPKSAGGSADYNGPVWDVVRVSEPQAAGDDWTLSKSRVYHINTTTGLIDRSFSQEQGVTVVAEYSGWVDRFGDKTPSHITWSVNGQIVMELTFNNIVISPNQ